MTDCDCRWAVATVMTRQNQIPSSRSDAAITALIPLWDMCNHCNGQVSHVRCFCYCFVDDTVLHATNSLTTNKERTRMELFFTLRGLLSILLFVAPLACFLVLITS